jgi:hypothetical protein
MGILILVKLKIFSIPSNTEKYEKHFPKNILRRHKNYWDKSYKNSRDKSYKHSRDKSYKHSRDKSYKMIN